MAELGEQARFLQKAVETPLVVVFGAGADGHYAAVERAHREFDRQILLDRHLDFEVRVVAKVGHAEAARAEHGLEPVLEQHRAQRQRVPVIQYFNHV